MVSLLALAAPEVSAQQPAAPVVEPQVSVLFDEDGDGWDDRWCATYLGMNHRDRTRDTDGDGLTDYDEMLRWGHPFIAGTPVGFALQSPWSWNGGPSFLTACVLLGSEPVCLGFWGQNIVCVGVQFLIAGQTHYGWVEVEVPLLGVNGGFVRSYAYESQPGVPILAGAVPEPSATLLLAGGLAVPLCRRWRRTSASHAHSADGRSYA